eukprot:GILI01043921.1.p1 GENE.GILI01043921.1~~GILI01043921.1.p1  ORF type:complete len:320 (+),score=25.06 GILI01043921.1:47-961(+)
MLLACPLSCETLAIVSDGCLGVVELGKHRDMDKVMSALQEINEPTCLIRLSEMQVIVSDQHGDLKICDTSKRTVTQTVATGFKDVTSLCLLSPLLLASAAEKCGDISLWDLETGACKSTLHSQEENVLSLHLHPNGYLISVSCRSLVRVWNVETEECLQVIPSTNERLVGSVIMRGLFIHIIDSKGIESIEKILSLSGPSLIDTPLSAPPTPCGSGPLVTYRRRAGLEATRVEFGEEPGLSCCKLSRVYYSADTLHIEDLWRHARPLFLARLRSSSFLSTIPMSIFRLILGVCINSDRDHHFFL